MTYGLVLLSLSLLARIHVMMLLTHTVSLSNVHGNGSVTDVDADIT